jgi:predicted alpha-1,2-mannosidase
MYSIKKKETNLKNLLKLAIVLTSVAALAGCGGDDHPTQSGTNPGDTNTAPGNGNTGTTPPADAQRVNLPLTNYVNVFVGTDVATTGGGFSGNTTPGAQVPFGMVNFGPDTASGTPGGYAYTDSTISFFSLTHLNGPGCSGQGGGGGLLPSVSSAQIDPANQGHNIVIGDGSGKFDHANESARPGYYKVMASNGVTSELTATTRTGMARITYPASSKSNALLVVDATVSTDNHTSGSRPGTITLDAANRTVSGTSIVGSFCGGTWNKPVYFYAQFDTPVTSASSSKNGVAILQFDLTASKTNAVLYKVGISSVSVANAKANLIAENSGWDFDAVAANTDTIWENSLNTIQVDVADPQNLAALSASQQTIAKNNLTQFYSAFYRAFSGPTVYSDVNGDYRSMKQASLSENDGSSFPVRATANISKDDTFQGTDGKTVVPAAHYSSYSIWDTYRSLTQLQALLFPGISSDTVQSLVADAKQCGALPHWVDGSDDTKPMEGNHAPSLVAAAYAFGAQNFDTATARNYLIQSQTDPTSSCNNMLSVGRVSTSNDASVIPNWLSSGFIATATPASSPFHTSSVTIEMVTADRSVGAFLSALPTAGTDQTTINSFFQRAGNWKNILNPQTNTLQALNASGQFTTNANAGCNSACPGTLFHEGTEPQYFWDIEHDYTAVIAAIGGNSAAITRLDTLFGIDRSAGFPPASAPPVSALNGGMNSNQFYIGNEPSLVDPWAYNWTGSPQSAQYIIPQIMKQAFLVSPGGLPGNDDLGATSTWYVWATLGLYPVVPSAPGMAISTPQFSGMTVWLGNGKKLRIETDQQAMLNNAPYIKELKLNGQTYNGSWLPLAQIANGGTLSYTLSATPTNWGTAANLTPPSGPNADYTKSVAAPSSASGVTATQ